LSILTISLTKQTKPKMSH